DRDVVRVVEHRGEIADLARDRLLGAHVTLVAPAEERDAALQLRQQTEQLLRQRRDGGLVAFRALVLFADREPILGVVVPAPEDVVAQRLRHQPLEQLGTLGPRTEKPRIQRFPGQTPPASCTIGTACARCTITPSRIKVRAPLTPANPRRPPRSSSTLTRPPPGRIMRIGHEDPDRGPYDRPASPRRGARRAPRRDGGATDR